MPSQTFAMIDDEQEAKRLQREAEESLRRQADNQRRALAKEKEFAAAAVRMREKVLALHDRQHANSTGAAAIKAVTDRAAIVAHLESGKRRAKGLGVKV